MKGIKPRWTVHYNIVSPDSPWVGTGWEFFDEEFQARNCYERQIRTGNCPTMRLYHEKDEAHLGVVHRQKDAKRDYMRGER